MLFKESNIADFFFVQANRELDSLYVWINSRFANLFSSSTGNDKGTHPTINFYHTIRENQESRMVQYAAIAVEIGCGINEVKDFSIHEYYVHMETINNRYEQQKAELTK